MKLTKEQRKEQCKGLARTLKDSPHLYFTEYQGLKFQDIAALRALLKPHKCGYRVVKNSLLEHAMKDAGVAAESKSLFDGPNALLFVRNDDPVSPAKILFKFAKDNENLKVKAGYVGGRWYGPVDCRRFSTLGTRPELLGQLAGVLYSTVGQAAWVIAAPLQQLVLVLKALEEKKSAAAAA
jgi:large subunit ribosomal protein L10